MNLIVQGKRGTENVKEFVNLASECWSWAVNPGSLAPAVLTLFFLCLCKDEGGAGDLCPIVHLNSLLILD